MLSPLSIPERRRVEEASRHALNAAMAVHSELGPGLLESAYEECLAFELHAAGLNATRQVYLPLEYKGVCLDAGYRIDLVVDDRVILEIKAVNRLTPLHQAQLISYLKISKLRLGLMINFKVAHLKDGIRRFVNHL